MEALCSHPFDSALAICARAAKRPEALSASAKVQLRVVPAVLASVTVVPSNVTRPATPEGFFTFMRGANRVGTHVLLQARDACGNALTRDVPEGLEVLLYFIRTTLVAPLCVCAQSTGATACSPILYLGYLNPVWPENLCVPPDLLCPELRSCLGLCRGSHRL